VACVPGDFGDHAQVDESQAHNADDVMFGNVIQVELSSQFIRPVTCRDVFVDYLGEGLVVGDVEAAVAAGGMAVARVEADAGQRSLEPDAFGGSTMLDQ
jgi:hypothetical protein